jgi:DHA2 family methylenomycin A resistance protein-like MFS transporter
MKADSETIRRRQHGDVTNGGAARSLSRDQSAAARRTSPAARRWALLAAAIGFGVVQLDVTAVNVAIRPISTSMGGGLTGVQWVVNAYTLGLASLILSAGALGDRIGAKRVFVAGFALFTVASTACGLAPNLSVLIGARAIQGVGAAVLIPGSLTLLNHTYPGSAERRRAVGLWAACASVALSAGPLIGGVLIHASGWRAIFFINAPLGALGIVLTLRHAAETPRTPRRLDLPGQGLAIVALCALAAAMITGGQHGFTSPFVLVGTTVALLTGLAFVVVEARSREPMLPLSIFRSRTFTATTSIGLVVNIAFYGLIFVLSLYFQTVRGYSVLATGAAFAPTTAAVFVGNLVAGRITVIAGARRTLTGSALLMATSLAGLFAADQSAGFLAWVGELVALGFGLGVLVPTMTSTLLGSVEVTRSGIASGTLNTARQTGSVIGVALFGALCNGHLATGLRLSLALSIALSVVIVVLAAAIHRDKDSTERRVR